MAHGKLVLPFLIVGYTTSILHPNVGLGPVELVSKYGFPLETHSVITEDGYILTIHRIPHGKKRKDEGLGQPVLLFHGILSSSVDWINLGETAGLGFMLAQEGYDVWMGNARGNTFSRRHVSFDPDSNKAQFWDFSWHEIGYYDVPAIVDLILSETDFKTIQYVGVSQGSTAFLVMASTRPEVMAKIKFAQLMTPAYDMVHMKSPLLNAIVPFAPEIYAVFHFFGIYELFQWSEYYVVLWLQFCDNGKLLEQLCREVVDSFSGYSGIRIEMDYIPVILSNFPAGSSGKQFVHYAQSSHNKTFSQFNYGSAINNIRKYGTSKPPQYDIGRITTPIALYYGTADYLVDVEDTQRLDKELPNVVLMKAYNCSHDNFVYSLNITKLINNDIIQHMAIYT